MKATAILVTRGDISLTPIVETFPAEWEVLIWDNGMGELARRPSGEIYWETIADGLPDLVVYGRYAALAWAQHEVIYVQDDDCLVSEPRTIVETSHSLRYADGRQADAIVCNMPQEFRHDFYAEHALVGFGAAFPRSLPDRMFVWFKDRALLDETLFNRCCDIIFTGLTQRVLVEMPMRSMSYAYDDNRMWRQSNHQAERSIVLNMVKQVANEMNVLR